MFFDFPGTGKHNEIILKMQNNHKKKRMSFDSLSAEYRKNHCRTRKELFAAISLQNGDDIKTVSENLDHASVTFTLDVYGHVTDKKNKDSADKMQAHISSL